MVRNVHERLIAASTEEVWALVERLGGSDDVLWPAPAWPPMVLDRPVSVVGARGGHGDVRYHVTAYEPGRMVEFTFDDTIGIDGTHTVSVEPRGPRQTLLRHVLEGTPTGAMNLVWPLVIRWAHDVVLEQLFDRAEAAFGAGPARPARWSWPALLVQRALNPRARDVDVPGTRLLTGALPRVDYTDAYAVQARRGTPIDPQVWADAVFSPPAWVVALLGVRQALVGLFGIERDDGSAFETLARGDDEVLLGTDAAHLDFRVSMLREPERVVGSTIVQIKSLRGRAYFALVRHLHPIVMRAMLTSAALRLSRSSNRDAARPATMSG
jgi:Protein of unknown function (DUF2867)